MRKTTLIIADDHPIFRNGVRQIIEENNQFELLAEGQNGIEAYQLIIAHRPDIAVLDLEMPHLTGLDVCAKIRNEKSQTQFVLLTMHKEKHFFKSAMEAGVRGYLLKDNASEDLIVCIKAVIQGKLYVSPIIAHYLHEHDESSQNTVAQNAKKLLSPTEKIIVKLISEAKSSAEIANLLFISINTVENHRANIAKKLALEGKNSLLKFAMMHQGQW
jgi:DNA-binding NarL/FixJ family response regulator